MQPASAPHLSTNPRSRRTCDANVAIACHKLPEQPQAQRNSSMRHARYPTRHTPASEPQPPARPRDPKQHRTHKRPTRHAARPRVLAASPSPSRQRELATRPHDCASMCSRPRPRDRTSHTRTARFPVRQFSIYTRWYFFAHTKAHIYTYSVNSDLRVYEFCPSCVLDKATRESRPRLRRVQPADLREAAATSDALWTPPAQHTSAMPRATSSDVRSLDLARHAPRAQDPRTAN